MVMDTREQGWMADRVMQDSSSATTLLRASPPCARPRHLVTFNLLRVLPTCASLNSAQDHIAVKYERECCARGLPEVLDY
ncbi:hypothetical protein EVAR_79098_1 [Eumeta japonica]|uniref:Uncharacterized protein n=1 Tax=Eumeta variegata TaxID=151549 RepID=A0A4C1X1W5_EUMVA|nr:hypothetical protein EVAR_79098_1 [Eumeta japonica]